MPAQKTAAEIEALVRARAEEAGLNPNHVWRDVKRRTETGRLVLHLLGLPDEWIKPPKHRPPDEAHHADRENAFWSWQQAAEANQIPYSMKDAYEAVGAEFGVSGEAVRRSIRINTNRNRNYNMRRWLDPEPE